MTNKIEWTDQTWNPVTGCTKISAGCEHCYAERMSKRLAGRCGYPAAPDNFKVTLHPDRLYVPFKWRKLRKVFVCSMSDLFHDDVPFEFMLKVFKTINDAPHHIFQLLTKRPRRMSEFLIWALLKGFIFRMPSNVWLGVTICNSSELWKLDVLRRIHARVHFVSFEPLLGEVGSVDLTGVDWVICGGESGHGARPLHPEWVRSLRDQCVAAGVPFLFKQWGEWGPCYGQEFNPNVKFHQFAAAKSCDYKYETVYKVGKRRAGRLLDGREWNQFPGDVE